MRLVHVFPREGQEMVFEVPERAFRIFGGVRRRGMMLIPETGPPLSNTVVSERGILGADYLAACVIGAVSLPGCGNCAGCPGAMGRPHGRRPQAGEGKTRLGAVRFAGRAREGKPQPAVVGVTTCTKPAPDHDSART